jgi:hypothetical protein
MQNINETVYETKSGRLTIVRPPPAQPAETAGWSEDCMRACALGAKVQLVPARKTQGWLNMACPAAKTPPAQPAEKEGWSEDCMRVCALGAKVQLDDTSDCVSESGSTRSAASTVGSKPLVTDFNVRVTKPPADKTEVEKKIRAIKKKMRQRQKHGGADSVHTTLQAELAALNERAKKERAKQTVQEEAVRAEREWVRWANSQMKKGVQLQPSERARLQKWETRGKH